MITSEMMDLVYKHHSYHLTSLQQNWLSPASPMNCADVIHNAGAHYTNCWGFVDETVRHVCKRLQRLLYNGHERSACHKILVRGCSKWPNRKTIWAS